MGAKGNSGVILSQINSGLPAALDGRGALDGATLAAAFERGQQAAYHVVSQPREGTILTGITAVALAAAHAAEHGDTPDAVLAAAAEAARGAAERTPDLMPLLREAGVVDAGAQGLYVMLDGMLRALRGEDLAAPEDFGAISAGWLAQRAHLHGDGARAGFCTECVIEGDALDPDAIRAHVAGMGDSLLVVGDSALLRVHVHTREPGAVLAYARTLGAVSREKAEDMEAQFAALAGEGGVAAHTRAGVAVVAVAAGAGIEALLRSLGAAAIVPGGQTMNPSAGEIRAAIDATGASEVIVLPNNKNIILAAGQALDGIDIRAHAVPSASIPQGVAALVAANPEATFDENVAAMEEAIASVRSGEVTLAARATRLRGIDVREGQPIALVDGELYDAAETIADATAAAVRHMATGRDGAIVTLYAGEGVGHADAEALAESLRAELGVEVEVVDGGQPHYAYLIGVE
jgi:DAK2 domain fusion protein YloV